MTRLRALFQSTKVVLRFLPVEKPEEFAQMMRLSPRGGSQAVSSLTNPIWERTRDEQDVVSGVTQTWVLSADSSAWMGIGGNRERPGCRRHLRCRLGRRLPSREAGDKSRPDDRVEV